MDKSTLENAILSMARDPDLLRRVQADPLVAQAELGLDRSWTDTVLAGDRDRLRSAGVNDGITILVSRWFAGDLADSASHGRFVADLGAPPPPTDVPDGLVFAGGCSHVPDLLARPEIDPPDAVARLLDGYRRMRAELAAANPDVLLVTADCHFQSFETGHVVIGVGERHRGSMEFFKRPDLDVDVPGAPGFANALIDAARGAGLELEPAPRVDLDHGLVVPLRLLLPRPDLAVIPVITQPARAYSPYNAEALGRAWRSAITSSGLRVGMLATGGLSHWLDPGKFGHVDVEFDNYILSLLRVGRGLDLAGVEPYPLLDHGQYEFLNWLIMLGIAGPGVRGVVHAYEPMVASGGGWTVVSMDLAAARESAPARLVSAGV
jgi:aromatic ring-opening dioxygenase catalytic subunit (LigB family)